MQYARINGLRRTAEPKLKAVCEHCHGAVQAKCGTKVVWHWAHVAAENCDSWYEPETQWHRDWKEHFGQDCSEISIVKDGVRHIADVLTKNGVVIEFQNSPIASETILAREAFYDKMIWVINGAPFKDKLTILDKDFVENWQVNAQLVTKPGVAYAQPETRGLEIKGAHLKQAGIREILTRLKFVHDAKRDLYSYDLENLHNSHTLIAKLQGAVLALYRAQKVEQKLKPVLYTWTRVRRSWEDAKKPVFIDLNEDHLLWIKSHMGARSGEGVKVCKKDFLAKYAEHAQ